MILSFKFKGFTNFLNALAEGNYNKAAQEMRDSRWGKQTPKIADTLAKKMSSAS